MKNHRFSLAVALALTLVVLPTGMASAEDPFVAFRTPNKAAYCSYWPGWHANGGIEGGFINGQDPRDAAIECWTPNDGFNLRMSRRGKVFPREYDKSLRGYKPPARRILTFGSKTTFRGISCASRRSGLTCVNRDGHGWRIGRFVGYRIL